jgi:hypothetical protein
VGQGLLIVEVSRSHSDKPHLVEILCKSDQPVAETSTSQLTTLTTDNYVPGGIRTSSPTKRAAADHVITDIGAIHEYLQKILPTHILFAKLLS